MPEKSNLYCLKCEFYTNDIESFKDHYEEHLNNGINRLTDKIYHYIDKDDKKQELTEFIVDYFKKLYKVFGEEFYQHISDKFKQEIKENPQIIGMLSFIPEIARRFLFKG